MVEAHNCICVCVYVASIGGSIPVETQARNTSVLTRAEKGGIEDSKNLADKHPNTAHRHVAWMPSLVYFLYYST